MAIINQTVGNVLYLSNCASVYTQTVAPYYGSLTGADNYFNTRLHTQNWDWSEKKEREAALHMATRAIEVLAFKGHKADPNQILFFPRTIDVGPQPVVVCTNLPTKTDFSCGGLAGYPPLLPEPTLVGTPHVPGEIEIACYEIALCLLNDIDPDVEARNLSVTGQGYAGTRTTYDRDFIQEHIRAGIPSAYAWSILRPYLSDPQVLRLVRAS